MSEAESWRRLHPLSPFVRGGRATIAALVLILPSVLRGKGISHDYPQLAIVAVLTALGFVSWLVTRWRVHLDDLQIETGLIRRRSSRFPLAQVQAIDIVRPGLARMFRVAELRLRMGGSTGSTARLAYLPEREAEPLRDWLLALAHGAHAAPPAAETAPPEDVVAAVPGPRLAAAILTSDVGLVAEGILVGLLIAAVAAPEAATGVVGGGVVWIVTALTLVWRRFNQEYGLTVAAAPDGLRLRGGLVALTSETIRPGRVQAVRMVEPLLWQPFGWCRLEVDLAGRQKAKGEGQAQRGRLRALLPVGSREQAETLLDVLLPDRPRTFSPPPARAVWKSPLRYRRLGWARSETCVAATSGRVRRITAWVPLEKAQSLRRVQGPLQRRLGLATVHVDTAGRSVYASLRDREEREADTALAELTELARSARSVA